MSGELRKDSGTGFQGQLTELRRELQALSDRLQARTGIASEPDTRSAVDTSQRLMRAALYAESLALEAIGQFDELIWSSQRDTLTQLPNRVLMLDRLRASIALARRHRTRIAVVFIDLDYFKRLNDEFGHATGDAALILVAERLLHTVRGADTVSRHGGDEFLVLLSDVTHKSDALRVTAKLLHAIAEPCSLGDQDVRLSASAGISVYPDDGDEASSLIDRADAAMYEEKLRRRGSRAKTLRESLRRGGVTRKPANR
jgi:diguanylate cyclase